MTVSLCLLPPWARRLEHREIKKKNNEEFPHSPGCEESLFLLLKLELGVFLDFPPSVWILVLAPFQVCGCLDSRLGDFEEKMGKFITGLVILWVLLFSPHQPATFIYFPEPALRYSVQVDACSREAGWSVRPFSYLEPVSPTLFLSTKLGVLFWVGYINLKVMGILWTVVSPRLFFFKVIVSWLNWFIYICKYEDRVETFQFCWGSCVAITVGFFSCSSSLLKNEQLKANILVLYVVLHLVVCDFRLTTAPGCTWEASSHSLFCSYCNSYLSWSQELSDFIPSISSIELPLRCELTHLHSQPLA